MKSTFQIYLFGGLLSLTACQLADVENPNVSTDTFLNTPQASASWVNGSRRQLALTTNQIIEFAELVSDNYFNNRTLSSKVFDIPQITIIDPDVNNIQASIHQLRASAEFGLAEVLGNDDRSTDEDAAQLLFNLGMAYLYGGEYFVGLPIETTGPVLSAGELLALARQAFTDAQSRTADATLEAACTLALARIAYNLGDRAAAVVAAQATIDQAPLLNYQVFFDGLNGVDNEFQFYLFDSSNDEFAPLPRLDFLDPKYFNLGNASQEQQPVSLFKVEEAYLILAEAQIAQGELATAQQTLTDLLNNVIAQRPQITFDDSREVRGGGNRSDYPLTADVQVKASPDAPAQSGLILDRQAGEITIAQVSGTSVTATQINEAADADALLVILYLMRQEIFIAEGRRMVDLGIKYPISETELLNNPNSIPANFQNAQIPDFIPGSFGMDDFVNDTASGIVTIQFDMNQILVANKASDLVVPFE